MFQRDSDTPTVGYQEVRTLGRTKFALFGTKSALFSALSLFWTVFYEFWELGAHF